VLKPTCPNCRESLSSVEHGLGGVWSCLYCEGCWLSSPDLQALAKSTVPKGGELVWQNVSTPLNATEPELVCPVCETKSFTIRSINDVHVHQCSTCQGVFFKKGTLQVLASHAFSASNEAPQSVGQVIGAGLLADVGFSVVLSLFF
jgi:Zn-finger nucleic acid-binding protein